MKDYTLTSWQDYWNIFDELIDLLNLDNKTGIVVELRNAQKYVNGLTDGWYDFKTAFEETHKSNRDNMTVQQNEIADFLMKSINYSLTNR